MKVQACSLGVGNARLMFLVLSSSCGLCEGFWCLGVSGLRALFCGFFLVVFVWC
jgi:hypothetical protein